MNKKIVVIGVNHAGTSAIRTLLAQDPTLEIVAFDRNDNISFLGCGIALSISGLVKDPNDLFYANKHSLEKMGAKIFMQHDVIGVNQNEKTVTAVDLKSKEKICVEYDKLIYASGSWPIDFKIKNSHLENIQICKLYQHATELIKKANDDSIKNVAIIGAGYIGIELAEAFFEKGKNVALIDMHKRVVPRYFDTEFTDILESDIRKKGITLALGQKVTEYAGTEKVEAVITGKGHYFADLVIECVGFKPNSELLSNVAKLESGAIIVNERMQTSDPDIYAIGDTAALFHATTQAHEHVALATNAVKSGIVAASQINGIEGVVLKNIVGTNAICVFDNKLASTGLSEDAAKNRGLKVSSSYFCDNDRPEFMNEFERINVKLVYETDTLRLIGAQIGSYGENNHTESIYYLALAIQQNLTLLDLAMTDVYFLPHFNKPFNAILSAIMQAVGLDYTSH